MRFLFRNFQISNPFYKTWLGIFGAAALFAALDSLLVLFKPLTVAFSGLGMSLQFANILAVVLCVIYLYVIDYGLSVFFPTAIQTLVSNVRDNVKDRALWAMSILTLIFCGVQVGMTIAVSLYLRHDSAKMTIAPPVLTDITALSGQKIDPSVLSMENDIDRLLNEKSKAVTSSQRNKELTRLADNGNGWAIGKLKELQKAAALPYDKQIRALQDKKAGISETNSQIQLAAITGANSNNEFLKTNYNQQAEHLANFLLYFAIGATIIECFAGLMLGLYKAIYGLGGIQPLTPTPLGRKKGGVITDKESVITEPIKETVITDTPPVITDKTEVKHVKIEVSDAYVREVMQEIKADLNNYKTGHGNRDTVIDRIERKASLLQRVIQSNNVSDKQAESALKFHANYIVPVLNDSVKVAA